MTDHDQSHHLEMLVQIAQLLATLDLDEVLLQTIRLTTDAVDAAHGSFFLLNEAGYALQRFIAARSLEPEMKAVVSQRVLESGLAGWVASNGQSALVEDTTIDPRWITLDEETEPARVRSALCVPFYVEGQLRGVMTLEHPEPGHFQPIHLRLVEAAANQAGAALRNAQLFDRVQTQQRHLEAVLNSIDEGLLVVDREGRLIVVNYEALALLGLPEDQVKDRLLQEVAAGAQDSLFQQLFDELSRLTLNDGRLTFELRSAVTQRDYSATVTAIQPAIGVEGGYVIALHDISTLKDLNRLKTHMIQMASHDLKNPIGVMRGYLDVLRGDVERGHLPDLSYLETMYKVVQRMETLVANLLDIQRAEQESPLRREPIDPHDLIRASVDDMTPSIAMHQHVLVQNVAPTLPTIKGDFARLREVMNNLLENAVKYTPDGGTITLNVSAEESRLTVNIKDTGRGIPASEQSRIFQPYFRAQGTEQISGTGVGLSLVKEIVQRHGGQVWFSSIEGRGSTFGFWLPVLN